MRKDIQIQNLCFNYGKENIFNDINLSFKENSFSIILGKNGSGKSSLFRLIAGLEKRYNGTILIGNHDRKKLKLGDTNVARLGFMSQFHQTTFPFKVSDVVLTGRAAFSRFSPTNDDREAVKNILEKFKLTHLKDKSYTDLSGGERQLILLCRVLVQNPDILILDEPTNHLDLHYQILVLETLQQLVKEGTTVLCVMHDPNLAFMYGDALYLMHNKNLKAIEGLEPIDVKNALEETYGVSLQMIDNQGKTLFVPSLTNAY